MSSILETLYDMFARPKEAFQVIAGYGKLSKACQIVFFSTTISSLAAYANVFEGSFKGIMLLGQIVFSVLVWGISVAVWHLLAELLGGRGSVKTLLTTIGFTYFLQLFIVPIYLIASFLPTFGFLLIMIATLTLAVWSIVLGILAIREVYQLSGGKATLVYFLPLLIFIGIFIVMIFTASTFFMSAATDLLANPPQF
ncbi:MAG: Yip1 protein [Firmicutes bacterium]|nr:Yip1 protein [Bacillota bacterium]